MDKRCNFYHECKLEYVDIGQQRGRVETRAVAFSFTEQRREITKKKNDQIIGPVLECPTFFIKKINDSPLWILHMLIFKINRPSITREN